MKKIFKNIAMIFMIGMSGITMNTEARLPKYMAPRAAELLIEKSELDFSDKYKQAINDILSSKSSENIDEVAEQILREVEITVDDFGSCYDVCKSMIADKVEKYNITGKNGKDQIVESVTKAAYACKLVDFLYSTKKRQYLANWFRKAYTDKKYHDIKVSESEGKLKNTFHLIKDVTEKTTIDGKFVNKHFPCWTGTLTCFFMGMGTAYKSIISESIASDINQVFSNLNEEMNKIVTILFTLEFTDNWGLINQICDTNEAEPTLYDRRRTEKKELYDPYDCVPVPNTAYNLLYDDEVSLYQGSCMISTIRNLIYMLCRSDKYALKPNFESNEYIRDEIKENLSKITDVSIVPGTTNELALKEFADILFSEPPLIKYEPTLLLFMLTLNNLLKDAHKLTFSRIQLALELQNVLSSASLRSIENILKRITNHENISVSLGKKPIYLTNWPAYCVKIKDSTIKKEITIGFGKRGIGLHTEILDIKTDV